MTINREQQDLMRAEYERRQCKVTVRLPVGGAVTFVAPVGGLDYVDLMGINRILRQLGYQLSTSGEADSVLTVEPYEQETSDGEG